MGVERLGRRSRAGEVADPANLDGVIGDAVIRAAVNGDLHLEGDRVDAVDAVKESGVFAELAGWHHAATRTIHRERCTTWTVVAGRPVDVTGKAHGVELALQRLGKGRTGHVPAVLLGGLHDGLVQDVAVDESVREVVHQILAGVTGQVGATLQLGCTCSVGVRRLERVHAVGVVSDVLRRVQEDRVRRHTMDANHRNIGDAGSRHGLEHQLVVIRRTVQGHHVHAVLINR